MSSLDSFMPHTIAKQISACQHLKYYFFPTISMIQDSHERRHRDNPQDLGAAREDGARHQAAAVQSGPRCETARDNYRARIDPSVFEREVMKPAVKTDHRRYDKTHLRKCEACQRFFLWTHDPALILSDLHFRCEKCRKRKAAGLLLRTAGPKRPRRVF